MPFLWALILPEPTPCVRSGLSHLAGKYLAALRVQGHSPGHRVEEDSRSPRAARPRRNSSTGLQRRPDVAGCARWTPRLIRSPCEAPDHDLLRRSRPDAGRRTGWRSSARSWTADDLALIRTSRKASDRGFLPAPTSPRSPPGLVTWRARNDSPKREALRRGLEVPQPTRAGSALLAGVSATMPKTRRPFRSARPSRSATRQPVGEKRRWVRPES